MLYVRLIRVDSHYVLGLLLTKTDVTPAILSRSFIARQSCSMQLCMSQTATLSHKQEPELTCVQHAQLHAATLSSDKLYDKPIGQFFFM